MNQEPDRDQELALALRRLEGDADLNDADWNRLRAGIAQSAARHVARAPESDAWWECIAGWARAALPLAAAVGVLLILLTPREFGSGNDASDMADPAVVERTSLAMIVSGDVREQEAVSAIVGPSDRGWLTESVMGGTER